MYGMGLLQKCDAPVLYLNFVFAFMRRDFGYKFFMALINSVISDRTAAGCSASPNPYAA